MKQTTAKTIKQALEWIDTNEHHAGEKENFNGKEFTHLTIKGYHSKLRIPVSILEGMQGMFGGNTREFDTRMFMVTDEGRKYLETTQ